MWEEVAACQAADGNTLLAVSASTKPDKENYIKTDIDMAAFAIYTYKFRDVENVGGLFLGIPDEDMTPLVSLQDKQNFVQSIFKDDLDGKRPFECARTEEQKNADGKKTHNRTKYGCKVVWEKSGLALLMVSNPYAKITRHQKFQKIKEQDEPWCHVLIDNRYGREFMAIEKNTAFNSPDTVASILESSFRARLAPHKVVMDIKNQYEPDAFWDVVEPYRPFGISEVSFKFAAPNHPWSTELIGAISDAARSMKARPTTIFSSPDGDPIELNKEDEQLSKYVQVCAMEGEDILVKVKGIRSRIHIIDAKDKYVFKQMSDETFRYILSADPELFDENFEALAAFLNQIRTSKEAKEAEE